MVKNGFTIVEIIIVIVILGFMGTLTMPKLFAQREVGIFSEGVSAAQTLLSAQQRYFLDHAAYTAVCGNLDVALTPQNFTLTCAAASPIVSIVRSGGPAYTIAVTSAGVYSCSSCVGSLTYLNRYVPN